MYTLNYVRSCMNNETRWPEIRVPRDGAYTVNQAGLPVLKCSSQYTYTLHNITHPPLLNIYTIKSLKYLQFPVSLYVITLRAKFLLT